jgi:site-specific DNA recombinase
MYATGNYTLRQVRMTINDLGLAGPSGGTLSPRNYQYILQNPIYYGLMRYQGEYYDGKHDPIIPKALFDRCQEVMQQKSKPKSDKLKSYRYRGMFRCGECGRLITTETQKGHNYLRCTKWDIKCSQPYVREEQIVEQVTRTLRWAALPAEWVDWMLNEARTEAAADAHAVQERTEAIEANLNAVALRLDRLMTAYTEGVMNLAEYRDAKNKLVDERRQLTEAANELEKDHATAFEPLFEFLNAVKQAGILAETGKEDEKRDFLKTVASNLTISDRHLSAEPRDAWQLVVDQGRLAQSNTAPEISGAVLVCDRKA